MGIADRGFDSLVEDKLKGETMEENPVERACGKSNGRAAKIISTKVDDHPGDTFPAKNKPSRGDGAPHCLLIRAGQGPDQNGLDDVVDLSPENGSAVRDPIGELISTVERAERRLAHRDSFVRPRRFPWAPDEDVEPLENEIAAMHERYR